eukprot:419879-Prymnesium_polylepis.2
MEVVDADGRFAEQGDCAPLERSRCLGARSPICLNQAPSFNGCPSNGNGRAIESGSGFDGATRAQWIAS